MVPEGKKNSYNGIAVKATTICESIIFYAKIFVKKKKKCNSSLRCGKKEKKNMPDATRLLKASTVNESIVHNYLLCARINKINCNHSLIS